MKCLDYPGMLFAVEMMMPNVDFRYRRDKTIQVEETNRKPEIIQDDRIRASIRKYTDQQWEIVQYALYLINGFKGCKGMGKTGAFTEEDYNEGLNILEGIRKGMFN